MILGPNSPLAIVRNKHYYIRFVDREGNEREFSKVTTWPEFLSTKRMVKEHGFEIVDWGWYK